MKRELIITGAAVVAAILLSSPSMAQTQPPAEAEAATVSPAAGPAPTVTDEPTLDEAVLTASTQEDRQRLLMRCSGPPPRPVNKVAEHKPHGKHARTAG